MVQKFVGELGGGKCDNQQNFKNFDGAKNVVVKCGKMWDIQVGKNKCPQSHQN